MKRLLAILTLLGLGLCTQQSQAAWKSLSNGGDQPWWNTFAKSNKCQTPEEERLQKFWHDYYDALSRYYGALDHVDWVAYYKNHGTQINAGCTDPCGCRRINYAPVFISPTMQWAAPNSSAGSPPCAGR